LGRTQARRFREENHARLGKKNARGARRWIGFQNMAQGVRRREKGEGALARPADSYHDAILKDPSDGQESEKSD